MNNQDEQMKDEIMRRVHAVRLMRAVFNPTTAKGAVLALSLVAVFSLVSVHHVVTNMSNLGGIYTCFMYLVASFTETSLGVQLGILIALVSSAWLATDIVRNLRGSMHREVSLG